MFSLSELDKILRGILNGSVSVFELPVSLYAYTCNQLNNSLLAGFNVAAQGEFFGSTTEAEKAMLYRQNIGRFSGAKTWQEINTLTSVAFDEDGKRRPFSQFRAIGRQVSEQYNKHWLASEQDAVIAQSQSARQWLKIEGERDLFPILEYRTADDDRVRSDHAALDGLVRPATDAVWDSLLPPNDWGCRCIVLQHTADKVVTPRDEANAQVAAQMQHFKEHAEFKHNAGKVDFVFNEKGKGQHSYFQVPREFEDDLRDNFRLPAIEELTEWR
ncbi:MAG: phage minor head protein [Rikenellaceae bacterium]